MIDIPHAKITRVCSTTNVLQKYNLYLNLMDNEAVVDL